MNHNLNSTVYTELISTDCQGNPEWFTVLTSKLSQIISILKAEVSLKSMRIFNLEEESILSFLLSSISEWRTPREGHIRMKDTL